MEDFPKFDIRKASNREEKLIVELIKDLDHATEVFISLHNPGILTQETFVVLRDSAIGYAAAMIRDLVAIIVTAEQKQQFKDECIGMFARYFDETWRH